MLQGKKAGKVVGEVWNASTALLLKLREFSLIHFKCKTNVLIS